jgi:hypothetical protein
VAETVQRVGDSGGSEHQSGRRADGESRGEHRPGTSAGDVWTLRRRPAGNERSRCSDEGADISGTHDCDDVDHCEYRSADPRKVSGDDADRRLGVREAAGVGGLMHDGSKEQRPEQNPYDSERHRQTFRQRSDSSMHAERTWYVATPVALIFAPGGIARNPEFRELGRALHDDRRSGSPLPFTETWASCDPIVCR